jgi:hypothetical protein
VIILSEAFQCTFDLLDRFKTFENNSFFCKFVDTKIIIMKSTDINLNLVDSYFTLLKNLSPNNKLELISRLSNSMKTKKSKKDSTWESLFGSWELDGTTDEFLEELKKDRNFSRKSVDL